MENPDALVQQARKQALENARAQAQQMAEALGITLGKPILVTEGTGYPVAMFAMAEGRGGRRSDHHPWGILGHGERPGGLRNPVGRIRDRTYAVGLVAQAARPVDAG